MTWQSAERVQKNSQGQYRALIDGQWMPAARAQKNALGEYRVELAQDANTTTSISRPIIGALETAGTVLSSVAAEPIAGLVGIAQSLNPFADEGSGARAVEGVRDSLTMSPETDEGKMGVETVGKLIEKGIDIANIPISGLAAIGELVTGQGLDKAAETIRAIRGDGITKRLGERAFEETGSPVLASMAESVPTLIGSLSGTKTVSSLAPKIKTVAQSAAPLVEKGAKTVSDAASKIFQYQTPARQKIAQKLADGSTDSDVAKYMLQGKKAIKDSVAQEAIKQGFDEGIISTIKGSSKADKEAMRKMVAAMQRGKKNAKDAALNRPADIAGDTLLNTYKSVSTANKEAGKSLDVVAKTLKGRPVEFSPAVDNFLSDLDGLGVKVDTTGGLKLDFSGSDIEGLKGIETAVSRIVKRMADTKAPDAYDVHRMKKYIDQVVSYGTSGETGLKGSVETVFKRLRHNLDESLDSTFPEYNKVNTVYSETRGAIDSLQDAAGKKLSLSGPNADKAVGTLLRRLLSNTQSRVNLMDSIEQLDSISKKHGGRDLLKLSGKGGGSNDLITQVLFVDELDRVFGPVARTSFQGQIEQGIKSAAKGKRGVTDAAVDVAAGLAEKARGINEDAAFKSMYDLLRR